jgi:hypothetical protein
MPDGFPGRPLLLKGALVVFELALPIPTNIIIFQYNPEMMTRKLEQSAGGDQSCASGAPRNPCLNAGDTRNSLQAPIESYSLTIELDAADQLEENDLVTRAVGLHPALAALELLLYPSSTDLILNKALSLLGTSIIAPTQIPLVLFVWGAPRVVPVQVTSISITEQAFDQLLNPIQAKVDLTMRSLTDSELERSPPPFSTLGLINQIAKEVMARFQIGGIVAQGATQAVRGLLPF